MAGVAEDCIERYDGPGPTGHFDWLKEPQAIARRIVALTAGLGARPSQSESKQSEQAPGGCRVGAV
jgi:hypothetical protein